MTLDKVRRQASSWGMNVSEDQLGSLLEYAELLANYEKANVVGSDDVGTILRDHVIDSLSVFLLPSLVEFNSFIDVGSGGGLPGVPLCIVHPTASATLLEATGKKAEFLRYVARELELANIRVLSDRAEKAGRSDYARAKYDVATIKAVARLDVNCEYCVPLLKKGGYMVSMKGRLDEFEMKAGERAANLLGAEMSEIIPVNFLPEIGGKERNLVILHKVSETPSRYPRKAGVPRKSPLGG